MRDEQHMIEVGDQVRIRPGRSYAGKCGVIVATGKQARAYQIRVQIPDAYEGKGVTAGFLFDDVEPLGGVPKTV